MHVQLLLWYIAKVFMPFKFFTLLNTASTNINVFYWNFVIDQHKEEF